MNQIQKKSIRGFNLNKSAPNFGPKSMQIILGFNPNESEASFEPESM